MRQQHTTQCDRGHRGRGRADRDEDPRRRQRADQRTHVQQRTPAAILGDQEGDDQRQPADQRHERDGVQKRVREQLRGAEEGGRAPGGSQPESQWIPPTARIDWRCVLEGQDREHQRGQRDSGDDPEQRPPGVSGGLDAADRWAQRHRAEHAKVDDHRRPAQLRRRIADDQRRESRDQQQARAKTLQNVADDEHT